MTSTGRRTALDDADPPSEGSADPAGECPRRPPAGRPAQAAIIAGSLLVACAVVMLERFLNRDWPYWAMDFSVYRLGAQSVLDGAPLYHAQTAHGLLFTYPPFAALIFLPFTLGPAGVAPLVWAGVEAGCLQVAVWLTLGAVGVRRQLPRAGLTLAAVAIALPLAPVDSDLTLGQVNLLVMTLVLIDVVAGRGRRWQGVGIGIAAAIKLVPLLFIVYLVITRRLRAAALATGVFLASIGAGLALLPRDSIEYWGGIVLDSSRVGDAWNPLNQSLRGVVARLLPDAAIVAPVWPAIAVIAGCAGLAVAVLLYRAGHQLCSALACGLTGVLVSPFSWEHHWVWIVPVLIVMVDLAWRRRSAWWSALTLAAAAVFGLRLLDWYVGFGATDLSPVQQLVAAGFPAAGVGLVIALAAAGRPVGKARNHAP